MPDKLPQPPPETPGQHCARWLKAAKKECTETNTVLSWERVAKIIDSTLTGLGYFNQVVAPISPVAPPAPKKAKVKAQNSEFGDRKAIPPTAEQVTRYSASLGIRLDGQEFLDHYESNGWKVGKTSMKDWQAAVRTWGRDPRRKLHHAAPKDYTRLG